jgi:hypothetical protein
VGGVTDVHACDAGVVAADVVVELAEAHGLLLHAHLRLGVVVADAAAVLAVLDAGAARLRVDRLDLGDLAVLAWLVATVTVVPLTTVLGDFILRRLLRSGAEIVVALEPKGLAIWLAVAVAGSALASYWPARQSTRVSTREALTFE